MTAMQAIPHTIVGSSSRPMPQCEWALGVLEHLPFSHRRQVPSSFAHAGVRDRSRGHSPVIPLPVEDDVEGVICRGRSRASSDAEIVRHSTLPQHSAFMQYHDMVEQLSSIWGSGTFPSHAWYDTDSCTVKPGITGMSCGIQPICVRYVPIVFRDNGTPFSPTHDCLQHPQSLARYSLSSKGVTCPRYSSHSLRLLRMKYSKTCSPSTSATKSDFSMMRSASSSDSGSGWMPMA